MRLFLRLNIVMVLLVAAALVGCKQEKDSSGGGVPGAAPIGGDSGGSDNFNGIVDSTPSNPDTSNAASGPNGPVRIIEETADGSVVMVGDFTEYDSQPSPGIVIVGSDGQVDQDFMESIGNGFNGRISGVKATEDGSVVIAGEFTDLNGSAQPNVVVVDSDGEIDTELSEALQNSVRGPVTSVDLHDGDQIVLAGSGETPLVAVDSESMEEVEATEEDEGHDLVDEAKESGDTHKKKKKKRKKRKKDDKAQAIPTPEMEQMSCDEIFAQLDKVKKEMGKNRKAIKDLRGKLKDARQDYRQKRSEMKAKDADQARLDDLKARYKEEKSRLVNKIREHRGENRELRAEKSALRVVKKANNCKRNKENKGGN